MNKKIIDLISKDENVNAKFRKNIDLTKEEMDTQIALYEHLDKNIREFESIFRQLEANLRASHSHTWREVNIRFWQEICMKYDERKLLNAYGDIFFVLEKKESPFGYEYVGKRVLWGLQLSEEKYHIKEIEFLDEDDCYDYSEFEVKVIVDKEQESNGAKS